MLPHSFVGLARSLEQLGRGRGLVTLPLFYLIAHEQKSYSKMKTLKIELTDKEFKYLQKIKLLDPRDRCHHNWHEFVLRLARFYKKALLKEQNEN